MLGHLIFLRIITEGRKEIPKPPKRKKIITGIKKKGISTIVKYLGEKSVKFVENSIRYKKTVRIKYFVNFSIIYVI